jgi:hypothetical protein
MSEIWVVVVNELGASIIAKREGISREVDYLPMPDQSPSIADDSPAKLKHPVGALAQSVMARLKIGAKCDAYEGVIIIISSVSMAHHLRMAMNYDIVRHLIAIIHDGDSSQMLDDIDVRRAA